MKKEHFHRWVRERVNTQGKLVYAAMAAMVVLGLIGLLFEGGILYAIFSYAYNSRTLGLLVPLIAFGCMGVFTWLTSPRHLRDSVHEGKNNGRTLKIRVAPTMANCWTFALGSLEIDRSIPERIFGMMMIVPRLFWTSWYLFQRAEDVKQIEVPECCKVLRLALKKAERVELEEFGDRFESMDLPKIFRQVSLIDGVVFLTKRGFGMSLANRFKEDLEKGLEQIAARPTVPKDEFEGA